MEKLYPDKDLKCHSFLTNVYTSHYYCGQIMVGYFIVKEFDDSDYDLERRYYNDEPINDIITGDLTNVKLQDFVSHKFENPPIISGNYSRFFIGKVLYDDFQNFSFYEGYFKPELHYYDNDAGNYFYKMCTQKYNHFI